MVVHLARLLFGLFIIFISLLSFSAVSTGDLSNIGGIPGWTADFTPSSLPYEEEAKYITATIDHTKIDEDLTDFPVLIHLSEQSGINNFDASAMFDELMTVDVNVNDNFTGNNDDAPNAVRWGTIIGSPDIQSNKLNCNADASKAWDRIDSRYKVSGDFDIQVDWDLVTYPSSDAWKIEVRFSYDSDYRFLMRREYYEDNHRYFANVRIAGSWQTFDTEYTSDTEGKFRFTRSGSNVTIYYWGGSSWVSLRSESVHSGDMEFYLGLYSTGPIAEAHFDNLIINSGQVVWHDDHPNRKKFAVYDQNGDQCYTEIERWDSVNKEAWLWVKVPYVSATEDTELSIYYDKDMPDNVDYIGDTDETPSQNVWDDNFAGVWHMSQDPSGGAGAIKDSTGNRYHATAYGSMTVSDLVDSNMGKAIVFDGTDDYLDIGDILYSDTLTIESFLEPHSFRADTYKSILVKRNNLSNNPSDSEWYLYFYNRNVGLIVWDASGNPMKKVIKDSVPELGFVYVAGRAEGIGNNIVMNIDGIDVGSYGQERTIRNTDSSVQIGSRSVNDITRYFDGIIDELRISKTARSAAWLHATYRSNLDDLISYASTGDVTPPQAPVADPGGPYISDESTSIAFDASNSSDVDSEELQYRWDFDNDGEWDTDYSSDPTATYTWYDDYTGVVVVEVSDGELTNTATTDVTVNNIGPVADAGADATIDEGGTFTGSGYFTDPGADTWTATVDYGDDSGTQTLALDSDKSFSLSRIYTDNGSYIVTVTVTDDDEGVGVDTLTVTVNNIAPTANAGGDQIVNEADTVSFNGSFTDPGADTHTIRWDFGDGSTATDTLTPTHAYGDNGIYTVKLMIIDDNGGVGTDTLTVSVNNLSPVITSLKSDNPSNGKINLSATFADKGWLDAHSCTFNFGDKTEEEKEEPDATGTITGTHYYSAEGTYTVSLVVEDDDGGRDEKSIEVLIDKTPPVITISEPKAKYYYNTQDITIDFDVEDPISNEVSSELVDESVVATLDGHQVVHDGQVIVIDLSELGDGTHTFKVVASDLAGNEVAEEVVFEVGPVEAIVNIKPQKWSLSWLDPFDDFGWKGFKGQYGNKKRITAYISLENVEVETILPTFAHHRLKAGKGYGDFVVVGVVTAQDDKRHGRKKIRSVMLKYAGTDEVDILASSGNRTWDFHGVIENDTITIDAGEGEHLDPYTVLSYYKYEPLLYSAADIIPETILLNGEVPIIEGSAELITQDPSQLDQSRVIAEEPFSIVREERHHVWLTDLGDPVTITLEVGEETIFEKKPYPIRWHDRFSLEEDGEMQMMGIYARRNGDMLHVIHHNLQEEARIYFNDVLALTILPDVRLVVLEVQFNKFDAISSLPKKVLERGGDWEVTTYEGVRLLSKHSRKHIMIKNLGDPKTVKLIVGDTIIFKDKSFPIMWKDRYFIVDGERQDISIHTFGRNWRKRYLSIHCRKLTRDLKLYLDEELVLWISPPPDVEVNITGEVEFDGNPATFDGSFSGMDEIELKGKIPRNYDIDKTYQRIDTSGTPALVPGDMFGDFKVVDFTEGYDDYRITTLEFRYDGRREQVVKLYRDFKGRELIERHTVSPGGTFCVDVSDVEEEKVYLKIRHKRKLIRLEGKHAVEVGDRYLGCTVIDITTMPEGPPHYVDLTLEYIGLTEYIFITAYDGNWWTVIGTYEVDPAIEPSFTIDGSGLRKGHISEDLVLEY